MWLVPAARREWAEAVWAEARPVPPLWPRLVWRHLAGFYAAILAIMPAKAVTVMPALTARRARVAPATRPTIGSR